MSGCVVRQAAITAALGFGVGLPGNAGCVQKRKRKRIPENREIEDAPARKRQGGANKCVNGAALLAKRKRTPETGIIADTSERKHPRRANMFDIAVQPDSSGVAAAATPLRAYYFKTWRFPFWALFSTLLKWASP